MVSPAVGMRTLCYKLKFEGFTAVEVILLRLTQFSASIMAELARNKLFFKLKQAVKRAILPNH